MNVHDIVDLVHYSSTVKLGWPLIKWWPLYAEGEVSIFPPFEWLLQMERPTCEMMHKKHTDKNKVIYHDLIGKFKIVVSKAWKSQLDKRFDGHTFTSHFFSYTLLVSGWTPFWLQNWINFSWHIQQGAGNILHRFWSILKGIVHPKILIISWFLFTLKAS